MLFAFNIPSVKTTAQTPTVRNLKGRFRFVKTFSLDCRIYGDGRPFPFLSGSAWRGESAGAVDKHGIRCVSPLGRSPRLKKGNERPSR
jgi:hypothetical protein